MTKKWSVTNSESYVAEQTDRQSSSSLIIINGLVDRKIRISDLVTQEVGPAVFAVVLFQDAMVLGHNLILVLVRLVA